MDDRVFLLRHLADPAELQARVGEASRALGPPEMLEGISDHLFVMQETLHPLGVPIPFASHEDWWRILDDR